MEKSVKRRAQNIEVPDINKNEMILVGLSDYVVMCAQCHGESDKPAGILTQGLNPTPPDLEHLDEVGTVAEMFWNINNGIRMTGMSAFGKTHQADDIWPVVSFLQSAKDITSTEYKRMKNEAEHYGHHKAESSMNDKGNGQQNSNDDNLVHEEQSVDTLPAIPSDQQTSEIPSLHQEEEGHSH
jgi:cbb3-type cytochrome c oxidase subunit III